MWRVVGEKLGHKSFFLVGHDWGGPTAYALAAAHPEAVRRLAILDVVRRQVFAASNNLAWASATGSQLLC